MLKPPPPPTFSKERINFLIALAVFICVSWVVIELFVKPAREKTQLPTLLLIEGSDTTRINMSGWDNADIDSFVKAQGFSHAKEDGSLHKVYYSLDLRDDLDEPIP